MTTEKRAVVEPPRRNIKPLTEKVHVSKPGEPPAGSKTARMAQDRAGQLGIPADTYQSKTWHYPAEIADGDCFMRNAQVTISNNGNCYFYGVTSTRHAGDVWLVKGLAFIDVNGLELWRMPQFDGPVMTQDNTDYIFSREDLAFPAYIFQYTTNIIMYHHC
jgi:hypothetical protein